MNIFYKFFCFVFQERCPYCSDVVKSGAIACDRCMKKIDELQKPIFRGACGFRCVSSFFYDGAVRRMLLRIKYSDRIQYLAQVAQILAKDIRIAYPKIDFDIITAVPMHPKELKKRGYNQSELLAKQLSKVLDIPYTETLVKVKHTKQQQKCTFQERKTNLRGAFKAADKRLIEGKNILIIDDIITSGETLGTCCKTLAKAKPGMLCCATVANAGAKAHHSAII